MIEIIIIVFTVRISPLVHCSTYDWTITTFQYFDPFAYAAVNQNALRQFFISFSYIHSDSFIFMHTIALQHIVASYFSSSTQGIDFFRVCKGQHSMKHQIEPLEISLHIDGLNPSSNYHKRTIIAQWYDERAQTLHWNSDPFHWTFHITVDG